LSTLKNPYIGQVYVSGVKQHADAVFKKTGELPTHWLFPHCKYEVPFKGQGSL